MLTAIQQPFFVVVFVLLGICMIACLIAANMIGTLTIATICLLSYALQQSWLLDVALIYTMISFLAVVVLTRIFIRRYKSRAKEQEKG